MTHVRQIPVASSSRRTSLERWLRDAWLIALSAIACSSALAQAQPSASDSEPFEQQLARIGARDITQFGVLPEKVLHRPLKRDEVETARQQLWKVWAEQNRGRLAKQVNDKSLSRGGVELKWLERRFGDESAKQRPLFISMHGGGGAPPAVNDQQWKNQIRLYEPEQGIVVAPRAPGNTWDLWHQSHIDSLFDELITSYVVTENVDPNRVYLMGYSAGGDGVYQLAPRMADRFAAASMMAGHPNESQPLGLRNLPFAIFMGGNDAAYNRNKVAAEWGKKLDDLQAVHKDGYVHMLKIYPGKGHWMDREDREALPWMLQYNRQTNPRKIAWRQDDVVHSAFYWLELVDPKTAKAGDEIQVSVDGNQVHIQTQATTVLRLRLGDDLVDLEKPVLVKWNEKVVFEGKALRTVGDLLSSLKVHQDPSRMWPASIVVSAEK